MDYVSLGALHELFASALPQKWVKHCLTLNSDGALKHLIVKTTLERDYKVTQFRNILHS